MTHINIPKKYFIVAEKDGDGGPWTNLLSPSKEAAIYRFVSHRFLHGNNLDSKICNEFFERIADFYEVKEYIVKEDV